MALLGFRGGRVAPPSATLVLSWVSSHSGVLSGSSTGSAIDAS